jgi:hypothetical protein
MALLGYTSPQSYLRVENVALSATGERHVVVRLALYVDSSKQRKIFEQFVEFSVGFSHKNTDCYEVPSLTQEHLRKNTEHLVLCAGRLFVAKPRLDENDDVVLYFEEESALVGAQILEVDSGLFHVCLPDGTWMADASRLTPTSFDAAFGIQAISANGFNLFRAVYEFLLTQPGFEHCIGDEQ